jgi:hypothetical protein
MDLIATTTSFPFLSHYYSFFSSVQDPECRLCKDYTFLLWRCEGLSVNPHLFRIREFWKSIYLMMLFQLARAWKQTESRTPYIVHCAFAIVLLEPNAHVVRLVMEDDLRADSYLG